MKHGSTRGLPLRFTAVKPVTGPRSTRVHARAKIPVASWGLAWRVKDWI